MTLRFQRRVLKAAVWIVSSLPLLCAFGAELSYADFNSQGLFNNFSGDGGVFAGRDSRIACAFDTHVFHGTNGASYRMDYAVTNGFCGVWNSLLGKMSHARYSLNFTNLYSPLHNSAGNPARVENIRVTNFSFWARGDGKGDFNHNLKVEFKSPRQLVGSAVFSIPNHTNWTRHDFPMAAFGTNDASAMKELVFVIEDWRNSNRVSSLYLDDLSFSTDEPAVDPTRLSDDAMLDLVTHRAFGYFLWFTDDLGFALDRSTFSDMVSVGTIGFQLTAYCIGHQRGWADRRELEDRVVRILRNLNEVPMGPEAGTLRGGYRGFFYHFLSANTGRRKDENVELSIYDTMLLMYGALTCREYFPTNAEIQSLSQQLFERVEWDWFVDRKAGRNRNRFYLAWKPGPSAEGTFFKHVDGQTDEAFMVDVLALGTRTHPVSTKTYFARNRVYGSYPKAGEKILVSWKGSLFNYFFASCWLNFEARGFDLHPTHPENLWENNRLAILANRQFCIDHSTRQTGGTNSHYSTYGENSWGLTACDNLVEPGPVTASEYFSFGALPTEENIRFRTRAHHAGTIAVYGAASSINFAPAESIAAIRYYFSIPNLWSPLFGFGDAFSLDPHYLGPPYTPEGDPTVRAATYLNGPWVNTMTMGINVGPMLLAIENYRSRQIWDLTAKIPEITGGLDQIFGLGSPVARKLAMNHTGDAGVSVCWDPEPGASQYSIFTSPDSVNWSLLQSGIRSTSWTNDNLGKQSEWFFRVKAYR